LAKAYRVTTADKEPIRTGVGPKLELRHHAHSRALFLYHTFKLLCRELLTIGIFTRLTCFSATSILKSKMDAVRTFIAIELPGWMQNRLAEVIKRLKKLGATGVRWMPSHNIHLTLKFLGEISPANLETLSSLIRAEASRQDPFEVSVSGLGTFPNSRRPRVIWVGVQAPPALSTLQANIEAETRRLGYAAEERGFSPHLTLGRVLQNASNQEIQRIGEILTTADVKELGRVTVESITLFRSDLQPSGSIYTPLSTAQFAHQRGEL